MRTAIVELGGWRRWLLGSAAILAVVTAGPSRARACGGFFCDQPGGLLGPLPIAQTGENVLFAVNPTPPPGRHRQRPEPDHHAAGKNERRRRMWLRRRLVP